MPFGRCISGILYQFRTLFIPDLLSLNNKIMTPEMVGVGKTYHPNKNSFKSQV